MLNNFLIVWVLVVLALWTLEMTGCLAKKSAVILWATAVVFSLVIFVYGVCYAI